MAVEVAHDAAHVVYVVLIDVVLVFVEDLDYLSSRLVAL